MGMFFFANGTSGQIIATSAEVTPNGGEKGKGFLIPQNLLTSGLGIIVL